MKFVFTGAGGGHFYPLIAVAEAVRMEIFKNQLPDPQFYFFSDSAYDEKALASVHMDFVYIPAGKLRVYASLQNISDFFKTGYGCIVAVFKLFRLYPDVIFAKGGYASFPTLFAARLLSIPVVVHESDAVPGRVTLWAGKFADRVAISQAAVASYFRKDHLALTGQPIRSRTLPPANFDRTTPPSGRPTILVLGGSQGSVAINSALLEALPDLLQWADVVHQTGDKNLPLVKETTTLLLKDHPFKDRYFCDGFIDIAIFYPKADFIICRAGSTTLFEVALWKIPSLVIPISQAVSRDQTANALSFSHAGTCVVLEETNLTPHLLVSQVKEILDDKIRYMKMVESCQPFESSKQSAGIIAEEMLNIAKSHN